MLSAEERAEIEHDLHHYPEKRAACIEAMKIVQRRRGWVPDDAITSIAELLDMSAAELDGVATFFNQIYRSPVGENVILFCESISCYLLGCNSLRDALCDKLGVGRGETTTDGEFTLVPTQCLGCCDHAPAMMVNDTLYHDVSIEGLDGILSKHRGNGPRRRQGDTP